MCIVGNSPRQGQARKPSHVQTARQIQPHAQRTCGRSSGELDSPTESSYLLHSSWGAICMSRCTSSKKKSTSMSMMECSQEAGARHPPRQALSPTETTIGGSGYPHFKQMAPQSWRKTLSSCKADRRSYHYFQKAIKPTFQRGGNIFQDKLAKANAPRKRRQRESLPLFSWRITPLIFVCPYTGT